MLFRSAFCVLVGFAVLIIEDSDRILDLSNPSLRNPRRSNSGKRVKYITRLTPEMTSEKTSKKYKDDLYLVDDDDEGELYESVGNMRVYKRGEKIEYHDTDED